VLACLVTPRTCGMSALLSCRRLSVVITRCCQLKHHSRACAAAAAAAAASGAPGGGGDSGRMSYNELGGPPELLLAELR
jgi:hypothetical protein